jgi:hypothetical protein
LEEKYKDLYNIISDKEGAERTEEIIESLKYMFDECRYDKVIPFIDYQLSIITWYRNQLYKLSNTNDIILYLFSASFGINIVFIILKLIN